MDKIDNLDNSDSADQLVNIAFRIDYNIPEQILRGLPLKVFYEVKS